MTALDHIPGLKGHGRRRAVDEIERLRDDVRRLLSFKVAADDYFARLTQDREDVHTAWRLEVQQRQEAETVAACVMSENEILADEVARLRAELANVTAIDVPRMDRDTTAIEDQATAPMDVRDLRERFASGRVVSLPNSPLADQGARQ